MNAHHMPEKPEVPLIVVSAEPSEVHGEGGTVEPCIVVTFNRPLTAKEVEAYAKLPPPSMMVRDVKAYLDRMMLAELVVSLFRTFVLGNIVLPETPRVMDWLKAWIDGVGHGPIGGPMRWPDNMPFVAELLIGKGYFRTLGDPGYVARRPPTKPQAPDERPASG